MSINSIKDTTMKIESYIITLHLVNGCKFHSATGDIRDLLSMHSKIIEKHRSLEPSYAEYLTVSAIGVDDNGDTLSMEMSELREDLC